MVAVDGNRPVRRRYTIRDLDPARQRLTMDIVRHGDGPGESWVRAARPGDTIEGIGPRGKIFPARTRTGTCSPRTSPGWPRCSRWSGAARRAARPSLALEIPEPADEQSLDAKADDPLLAAPVSARPPATRRLAAGQPSPAAGRPRPRLPVRRGQGRVALREVLANRGLGRTRCRPRPTGAAAGRTPATASPPGTASAPSVRGRGQPDPARSRSPSTSTPACAGLAGGSAPAAGRTPGRAARRRPCRAPRRTSMPPVPRLTSHSPWPLGTSPACTCSDLAGPEPGQPGVLAPGIRDGHEGEPLVDAVGRDVRLDDRRGAGGQLRVGPVHRGLVRHPAGPEARGPHACRTPIPGRSRPH